MKTTADMQTARTMWMLGASYNEIATELGVNRDTVAMWIKDSARQKHVAGNRRWRERQRKAREKQQLVEAMLRMRYDGASWPGIAKAVKAFTGRQMSPYTVRNWCRDADPNFPRKPRGVPFGAKNTEECGNDGSADLETPASAGTIGA